MAELGRLRYLIDLGSGYSPSTAMSSPTVRRERQVGPIMQSSRLCKVKSQDMIQQQAECRRQTSRSLHNRGILGVHTGKQNVRSTMNPGSDYLPARTQTLRFKATWQYLVECDANGRVLRVSFLSSIARHTTAKIMSSVRQRQLPPSHLQKAFCQKLSRCFP